MNLSQLKPAEQRPLLDLVLLAMYADGHLASAEDERIHRLLTALGHVTEYERAQEYDAAVSRLSRPTSTAEGLRTRAVELASGLPTREQRRWVQATLDELVTSDRHVSLAESELLAAIREALER